MEKPQWAEAQESMFIIGLDWGSTWSGIAHTYVGTAQTIEPGNIDGAIRWPGSGATREKVPTKLAYVTADDSPSERIRGDQGIFKLLPLANFKWGFDLGAKDPVIEYIKLLLQPERKLPNHIRRIDVEEELNRHDKTIQDAATDFLRALKRRAELTLMERYPSSLLEQTHRQFILTVPAMWDDAEKALTKEVAIDAGFPGDLQLVSEPEAAGLWALRNTPGLDAHVGDTYIVCDAGGGTVDLISYEIIQMCPFKVREVVPGTGGLCGGAFVNKKFEQFVRDRKGVTDFETFKKRHPDLWMETMQYFESGPKTNFLPLEQPHKTYSIRCFGMSNDESAGIQGERLTLTTPELRAMFDPVIKEVANLTSDQVEAVKGQKDTIQAILLVGGFGQSSYLLQHLKDRFQSQSIPVFQPPNPWSAVARGAVLWGVEGSTSIESRKSRYHYGCGCIELFDADLHPQSSKVWNEHTCEYIAVDRFRPFIRQGQTVRVDVPISHSFFCRFWAYESRVIRQHLYTSKSLQEPTSVSDTPMTKLGSICTDLSKVPSKHFKTYTNPRGYEYQHIEIELTLKLESGGLKFGLEVDGVEYSAVSVEFA